MKDVVEKSVGNGSNKILIIAGVLLVLGAIIYFIVNGKAKPEDATTNKTLTDAEKAAKAKADAEQAAKDKADYEAKKKTAFDNPPRYKRPGNALNLGWSLPSKTDLDYYIKTMRDTGWSDEMISYGAAWMKGMDLPINTYWATTQIKNIRDFKAKVVGLPRQDDFMEEIRNYPFMPTDLVDDSHTSFSRLRF
jgi:hypothetical protein